MISKIFLILFSSSKLRLNISLWIFPFLKIKIDKISELLLRNVQNLKRNWTLASNLNFSIQYSFQFNIFSTWCYKWVFFSIFFTNVALNFLLTPSRLFLKDWFDWKNSPVHTTLNFSGDFYFIRTLLRWELLYC